MRETCSTAPARIGGYRKPLLAGHEDMLRQLVAATIGQLVDRFGLDRMPQPARSPVLSESQASG